MNIKRDNRFKRLSRFDETAADVCDAVDDEEIEVEELEYVIG